MLKITEINEKIETLTIDFDNCFDENWEIENQDRFEELKKELTELKKLQLDIVNKQCLIKIDSKEYNLSKEKINSLIIPFIPMVEKYLEYIWDIEDIKKIPQEEYTEEVLKKAKRLRLDIAKVRSTTWKIKTSEKEIVNQIWWVTQKCHNIIVKLVEEQEEKLENIEKYFETKEKARILKLTIERQELLKPFEVDNLWLLKLWDMEESIFNNFLQWCKVTFEQKKEAEEKIIAEEKRIAEEKIEQEIILKEKQDTLTERKIEISKYSDFMIWELSFNLTIESSEEDFTKLKNSLIESKNKYEIKKELEESERIEKAKKQVKIDAELEAKKQAELEKERVEKEKLELEKKQKEEIERIKKEQEEKEIVEKQRVEKQRVEKEEAEKKELQEKEILQKREDFRKYSASLDFNHYEDKEWKRIFYKKVWEFIYN